MSDVELLIRVLEQNPDSYIAAAMLVDELMDCRDMTRAEADRQVEMVRTDAIKERDMRTATRVMSDESPYRDELRRACIVAAGAKHDNVVNIILVHGDRYPSRRQTIPHDVCSYWDESTVLVGTAFIIRHYRMMPARKWPNRSAKRKRRK